MELSNLTLVDLFCGGGGSSCGLHAAGFTTVYAVDQEEFCVRTFNHNFGNVARVTDVAKLHSLDILSEIKKEPFLITASPPCEPYTAANKNRISDPYQRMFDDPVGRLMLDAIRIIADLQPKYYLIENVVGILQGKNKELLTEEFLKLGLDAPIFNVVQAIDWGVPSYRQRVIISNIELPSPHEKYITTIDAIGDLPPPNYPTEFTHHTTITIPNKYLKKVPRLPPGEGLVFFTGAKKQMKNYMRLYADQPAEVIMGKSKFLHPTEDRLLTAREHARLMTFPDEHKFLGNTEQIYDMVGEAVPPLLMQKIGEFILQDYIHKSSLQSNTS